MQLELSCRDNEMIHLRIFQSCIMLPESCLCLSIPTESFLIYKSIGILAKGHSTCLHRLCTVQLQRGVGHLDGDERGVPEVQCTPI